MGEAKLPWPKDAVMIVAPYPEKAKQEHMDSVMPGTCRHCGKAIVYDGWTYQRGLLYTHGRPIKFFCTDCATLYDVNHVDRMEDHRARKRN